MSKRALISVTDKSGVVEFARELNNLGYEVISTGNTFKILKENGVNAITIDEVTKFPEMLDGRVKTLNPYSKEILISSIIPIFFICKFVIISHLEQLFTKKLYYMYICLSIHLFLYFTLTLFSLYFIVIIYNL